MESAPQQQAESGASAGRSRKVNGLFQPGQSGNPRGRPKKTPAQRTAEQITRAQAQAAIERLMGKAISRVERALGSKNEQLALHAALDVLDRGLGKATQRIEGSISAETTTVVTPAMLRMAAQRLLEATAVDVETVEVER